MKKILYWNAHNNSNLKNINFIQKAKTGDTIHDRKWKNNIHSSSINTTATIFQKIYTLHS